MFQVRGSLTDLRHLTAGLARDFASWPARGPRIIDEVECVLSVLLAIAFAHLLDAKNIGWAAFSGYMVIRSHLAESLSRGTLRVIGTAVGAASAWLLASHILAAPILLSLALTVVGGTTLYLALISRQSYAWLFVGLTFAMVLIDGMEHPDEALGAFARSRFIEVFAGTLASVLVSAISTATIRRQLPDPHRESAPQAFVRTFPFWHKAAFWHALQGAIALGLIPWVWLCFGLEALSQSSTTIMAVMMMPLASLSTSLHSTRSKLLHRFVGCSLGGLLATAILLIGHQWPWAMMLALCIGVVIGRHVENGALGIGYIGTQFAIAFLLVLVPDTYSNVDIEPGLDRLVGILFGMVLLEPVRFVFHQFQRS